VAFIGRGGTRAIVAANHYNGPGEVLTEDEHPVVITAPIESPRLGGAILAALRATEVRQEKNLRERKVTEWPSFRASGAESVREFERDFIRMSVSGVNSSNLIYAIESSPPWDDALSVSVSVPSHAEPSEVTRQCLRVWRACRDRTLAV
jgi:hypothetical protein